MPERPDIDTILTSPSERTAGEGLPINPPVVRASTVAFPSLRAHRDAVRDRFDVFYYGRMGTPTTFALEDLVARLEGGGRTVAIASGLGAITTAILSVVATGDQILVTDNVYAPVRACCERFLKLLGIDVVYFDPMAGDILPLVGDRTRAVFLEAPGSLTFEVPDVPALCRQAREAGLTTLMDNTWATPYFFRPREHGVDVSIIAGTKYIVGHSDAMLGLVTVDDSRFQRLNEVANFLGNPPGPDDCALALRGLRTLGVRLRRHEESALKVATWLASRPEVRKVLYPPLPESPGHEHWRRDFDGASGLFSVVLEPAPEAAVEAFADNLRHFRIGASWGGYESLVTRPRPEKSRSATSWDASAPMLRFHIGLENPDDLIADLEDGLLRYNQTRDTA